MMLALVHNGNVHCQQSLHPVHLKCTARLHTSQNIATLHRTATALLLAVSWHKRPGRELWELQPTCAQSLQGCCNTQ